MLENILNKVYETEKQNAMGFSDRLYADLYSWTQTQYKATFKAEFDPRRLKLLAENIDSKLPKDFFYQSLVDNLKDEVIGLKNRNYSDLQISILTSIISAKDLLGLEKKIGKPKKTIIGFATMTFSYSLATKEEFVTRVDKYFSNYAKIVELYEKKGKKIARSLAISAFHFNSERKALDKAAEYYNNYESLVNEYKEKDEDIAKSIAIRCFFKSNFRKQAQKYHDTFQTIYEIYALEDRNLAKSIAHWTFMASNPKEQAKKLYDKLKQKE